MRLLARSIALAVVLSLLLSGPAAPLAAAQQPAPAQPDLMQEALKTTQRDQSGSDLYDVGAGFANIAYVPGKAFVCGLGVGAGVILLIITLGHGYKAAAAAGEEGCGGKWVLKGDDLRAVPRVEEAARLQ
ncbi:MAG TPA: hypothetical protein VKG64_05670 [Methylomirabilota bacterium]|nr:hypothetical protein [Methylomirabilota bacterium]